MTNDFWPGKGHLYCLILGCTPRQLVEEASDIRAVQEQYWSNYRELGEPA